VLGFFLTHTFTHAFTHRICSIESVDVSETDRSSQRPSRDRSRTSLAQGATDLIRSQRPWGVNHCCPWGQGVDCHSCPEAL